MTKFVRMYEFLSQIVDYEDEELLKLNAFLKRTYSKPKNC